MKSNHREYILNNSMHMKPYDGQNEPIEIEIRRQLLVNWLERSMEDVWGDRDILYLVLSDG